MDVLVHPTPNVILPALTVLQHTTQPHSKYVDVYAYDNEFPPEVFSNNIIYARD